MAVASMAIFCRDINSTGAASKRIYKAIAYWAPESGAMTFR